ncbi:hypothetical protein GTA08_BOTSDO07955 [Botryosphaeria dothidea]|uniref:Uncharacterized protein n=1 Tax=Botryosphaeria dothidea TaxID=55169 RepID=A0A8H4IML2_9PEZI|nr:hypothetical protein GTA08_BOTSDO07955 [Botryosphaeria dothidea]
MTSTQRELRLNPFQAKVTGGGADYAQQCYSENNLGTTDCNTYVKRRLEPMITRDATCPFPGLCQSENTSLLIDTGFLNSHEDFGINAPPSERFTFRRVTHCAPLSTKGRKSYRQATSDRLYAQYHYGPFFQKNYTWQYPDTALYEIQLLDYHPGHPDYEIFYMASEYSNGTRIATNYWDPIPELDRKDADVEMYFLSANRVLFAENTTDEWYKASRPAYNISRISTEATLQVYLQDEVASPLACAHQEQFCNPNLPKNQRCAPLIGAAGVDAQINAEKLFPESAWPRFEWIYRALVYRAFRAPKIVKTLGSRVLSSKYALFNSVQGPIPDNQWQLDVENWHNATLALLQDAFVSTARGDHDPRWSQWFYDPPDEESKKLCKSQKIRSNAYVSFNVFGLFFIFCLGGLIMLVSITVAPIKMSVRLWRKDNNRRAQKDA